MKSIGNDADNQESLGVSCSKSETVTSSFGIIGPDDRIVVTGASGFIGSRVVENLLRRGFRNILCLTRRSISPNRSDQIAKHIPLDGRIKVLNGNLLSPEDCAIACDKVAVIYHLAAGTGEKSFPEAFLNSVVTTRNLLEASRQSPCMRRFVLVSSFAVYSNRQKTHGTVLDESCPIEEHPELRGDAYCYAKIKQEKIVREYSSAFGIPHVVLRPGSVYGTGKNAITGRVGVGTFGIFVHLGGSNIIPFTHVENCAEAIVLGGLVPGVDGAVLNVVDDDLPSSRQFLRGYKRSVANFTSLYMPHVLSYAFCYLWEKYSHLSHGQLPLAFTLRRWHAEWKRTYFSNQNLKRTLGWVPKLSTKEGLRQYFISLGQERRHA